MNDILELIILTLLPVLELRASIPYGILNTNLPILSIFFICVITNILLGVILYWFLHHLIHFFLRFKIIKRLYQKTITKAQEKVKRYVQKYGVFGLAIFIGIPLPGSGVYTAALGAYLLGFKFKEFLIAAILGVLIAGGIVLIITTAGNTAFDVFIKRI